MSYSVLNIFFSLQECMPLALTCLLEAKVLCDLRLSRELQIAKGAYTVATMHLPDKTLEYIFKHHHLIKEMI